MSKPVVHYRGTAKRFGLRAIVQPVDHPNHLPGHDVSNIHEAITSEVVAWDDSTGVFETKNTIYKPEATS